MSFLLKYREYPFVITYTWNINSVKSDSVHIPCLDKDQVGREVIRCLGSSTCKKVEVIHNYWYDSHKTKKWLDIKSVNITPERAAVIDAEVKKELAYMVLEEAAPDTVRNVGATRLHSIPYSTLMCGEYQCYCCAECKIEDRKRIENK